MQTGNPNDLSILGDGFFAVGANNQVFYTRQGIFSRDGAGRLINPQGYALQAGGSDLVLKDGGFTVEPDGTVLQKGEPVAKIDVVDFKDRRALVSEEGGMFSAPQPGATVDQAAVRQGALESSNVSMGEEMISIMEALRRAESGQKLMNVYDDLMARAITSFGQG